MAKKKGVIGAKRQRQTVWMKNSVYALMPLICAIIVRLLLNRDLMSVIYNSSELLIFSIINGILTLEESDKITSEVKKGQFFSLAQFGSVMILIFGSLIYGISLLDSSSLGVNRTVFLCMSIALALVSCGVSFEVQRRIGEIEESGS